MYRKTLFASLLASSAVVLAIASPAVAGTTERAREAIAAAEAKIHTAESIGAPNDDPRDLAEAHQALANAKNDFDADHRDRAIQEGIRASGLADTAIGISHQRRSDALASARQNERATAEAAQDQVAATQAAARNQVDAAQQQAAAASAADAAAARNAAALAAQTPPPAPQVETTVTTQHAAVVHHPAAKTVVKRTTTTTNAAPATSSDQVTTTTRVTPQ
jgi:hypothetical protein